MNLPIWAYLPASVSPPRKGVANDFSGIVEVAGDESGLKPGDEVFGIQFAVTTGTLQQLVLIDTKDSASLVVKKPSTWTWEQAAALPLVWLTARTTIAAVEPDVVKHKRIAVLGGSSSTGMYAVHLAAARGWDILTTCSGRNADFVRSMGASTVVDYMNTSVPDAVKKYAPDAVVDCVGGTECLELASRYVTIVGDKTSRASMGGSAIYL
ncbi:hypothetical protein AAFC00_006204 [Neodothiora populina]|uniref:Alcohol dehydrogenase-like C-terminal domain-containing protein n=1 Tax=Neodothiora populina TaxID=2781224 RepID=A0ABR3P4Q6_9PEZI